MKDDSEVTEVVAEDEDADLANASEWGDEDMEDENMEEAAPVAALTADGRWVCSKIVLEGMFHEMHGQWS